MFAYQVSRGTVEVAFTDRHGGVSGGAYASLNLAASTADDAGAVQENTARVTRAFTGAPTSEQPPLVLMRQVHGDGVAVVDGEGPVAPPTADALVTTTAGPVLMVRAADCVPVVLADPTAGVVAVAHAGRVGMAAGIIPATTEAMRDRGAGNLVAWVGPHVCGSCYEVPEAMRAEFSAHVPEAYAETSWGTPALDIGAGVSAQLRDAGAEVVDFGRCTFEDADLFSYRRQGAASGRLAGLVRIRP